MIAFGLGVLAFGYTVMLDTVAQPFLPSVQGDVGLWGGVLLAVVLGALAYSKLEGLDAKRLGVGGGIAAGGFLVSFAVFMAWLVFMMGMVPSQSMYVEEAQGDPVATLDPNVTYEDAPELAQALDKLVGGNASSVLVASNEVPIQRAQDHLVAHTGDYVDPFSWRGVTVRASIITS